MSGRFWLTEGMRYALRDIQEREDDLDNRMDWHRVGALTAQALLDRGLIEDDGRNMGCTTPGHTHPGYLRTTPIGGRIAQASMQVCVCLDCLAHPNSEYNARRAAQVQS